MAGGFESVQIRIQGRPAAVAAAYEQLAAVLIAPGPLNTRALRESRTEVFGRFAAAVPVPEGTTADTSVIVVGEVIDGGRGRGSRSAVRGGRRAVGGGR